MVLSNFIFVPCPNAVAEAKGGEAGFFGATPPLKAASNRPEPRPADFSARSADPHFALDVLSHIIDRAAHGGTRVGPPREMTDAA